MTPVHFYTRQGCHLCELALEQLLPVIRGKAEIIVRDIDTNDDWRHRYDVRVPVVEIDGEPIAEYPLDLDAISHALSDGVD